MSTQPSSDRKQPTSVYTVLLILATVFMLIAVIAMYMEYNRWGPDFDDTKSARPSLSALADNDVFA